MELHIAPPSPFLPAPGQPSTPWKEWILMLDNYFVAIGADTNAGYTAKRKIALLLHCLGSEGQRIYNSIKPRQEPDTTPTYDSVVILLSGHFAPEVNEVAARYRFRQRGQQIGESTDNWVAVLRGLAVSCNYGDMEDAMIRDQIVEKTAENRIREHLLMKKDLKLDKTLEIARTIERAMQDAKTMGKGPDFQGSAAIQRINQPRAKHQKAGKFSNSTPKRDENRGTTGNPCGNCGGDHAPGAKCPAKGATCHNCGKNNHFSRVCRSKSAKPRGKVRQVDIQSDEDSVKVFNVTQLQHRKDIKLDVAIYCSNNSQKSCQMVVDTGSSATIMPANLYYSQFSCLPLLPTSRQLFGYGNQPLEVLGCTKTTVRLGSRRVSADIFVVKRGSEALMGMGLFDQLGLSVRDSENRQVRFVGSADLRSKYPDLFGSHPGLLKGFMHRIQLREGAVPVVHRLRRVPFAIRERVSQELQRLEDDGVIEKVDASDWVNPMVPVVKPSGAIRICADLRDLNEHVIMDQFPMPTVEEILSEVQGSRVFTKIDLKKVFFQVALHPESKTLTAFLTHDGLYQYCRLPMGLCSSPGVFQKIMQVLLQGLKGRLNAQDDVLVHGQTQKEHDSCLEQVLGRLQAKGACLEYSKLVTSVSRVEFYGHIISSEGVEPLSKNVEAIKGMPRPTDLGQISSFLSTCSYYSRFVPGFARIAEPLRIMLRKDGKFEWSPAAESAWSQLKTLITTGPVLGIFDPSCSTIVTTDASGYGLGAILSQIQGGTEKTIAYASHTLSAAERKYLVTEREALACVWSLEKWRIYLWGRRFTLRTDHQALHSLLTTSIGKGHKPMRLARWYMRLSEFHFDVIFRPGSKNHGPDLLSLLPLNSNDPFPIDTSETVAHIQEIPAVQLAELKAESAKDPQFQLVRNMIVQGWEKKPPGNSDLLPYFRIKAELWEMDGLIWRSGDKILVPTNLRRRILDLAHEGHMGIVRTKQRLRDSYWWPSINHDCETLVKTCPVCISADKTAKIEHVPSQAIPFPHSPWVKLGLDICGPFATAPASERYLIVLQDYHSKWRKWRHAEK